MHAGPPPRRSLSVLLTVGTLAVPYLSQVGSPPPAHRRPPLPASVHVYLISHHSAWRPGARPGGAIAREAPGERAAPTRPLHAAHSIRAAHATADPAVEIADFAFTPGATTIHVGDIITWTNHGPSSHTATARDGSFDTGVLSP